MTPWLNFKFILFIFKERKIGERNGNIDVREKLLSVASHMCSDWGSSLHCLGVQDGTATSWPTLARALLLRFFFLQLNWNQTLFSLFHLIYNPYFFLFIQIQWKYLHFFYSLWFVFTSLSWIYFLASRFCLDFLHFSLFKISGYLYSLKWFIVHFGGRLYYFAPLCHPFCLWNFFLFPHGITFIMLFLRVDLSQLLQIF